MLIYDLDSIPNSFKEGYRGILLLHRSKDGLIGNSQRKAIKKISSNPNEWLETVKEFRELQEDVYPNHRIYASVNARNITKAIHEFKLRQVAVDYGNIDELNAFYSDIQNRFFSCFMNPGCKKENNFLIDCDSWEEFDFARNTIPEELIIFTYPTKRGNHIITKPFNPNEYNVEIKKDGLIFIG